MDFDRISASQEALKKGDASLTDIVNHFSQQISEKNDAINAFTSVDTDQALEQAELIQDKISSGNAGKLAGAVLGIKDLICEKDKKTTCGSRMLANFESVYDATVIEKLRAEDAIFLGRTNMDEFAMGSSNENSFFGPVKNPHDLNKVPGGSSGGSAAAVGARMVNGTLGSDTGGSIRQPASFCGTVGLKPTYGRVSRHGLVAFSSSMDCIGPFTHSVHDAALLLNTIAGFDEMDNTSSRESVGDYTQIVANPNKNVRIGVPEEFFGFGLDPEIKSTIDNILVQLQKDGAELVPIHIPHMKYSVAVYYILATAEASSNLARYDGIRFGHRADRDIVTQELAEEEAALAELIAKAEGEDKRVFEKQLARMDSPLIRLYKKSRTEGFGTEVKRRIMLGTYVLSSGYYDAYYAKAQKIRRLIQNDFKEAFKSVDVIVSPTAPTTAFDIGSKVNDPVQMYLNDIYTISANLAGICAISVPAGDHSNGMPFGVQFMGNSFREHDIFNAGQLVENILA